MATQTLKPYQLTPRVGYLGNYNCAGDKYMIKAKLSIDPITGDKIAVPGDKFDLDAYIQSHKASTDIVSIIERLNSGDTSVINVRSDGIEGDLTKLPKNINDMVNIQNVNQKAYEGFNGLPDNVKALFNNDPAEFFDAVLTNKVDEIMKNFKPDEKVEEAVANE